MTPLEIAVAELQELKYETQTAHIGGTIERECIVINNYSVPTGHHRGEIYRLLIDIGIDGEYPEYPPHFIGVANMPPTQKPVHSSVDYDGVTWSLFSAPPGDFWDRLASEDKNMKTYFDRHLLRFWSQA